MRVNKAEFLENCLGSPILRMMAREQTCRLKILSSPIARRATGFSGQSLSPELFPEVKSELIHTTLKVIGPKTATTDVSVVI